MKSRLTPELSMASAPLRKESRQRLEIFTPNTVGHKSDYMNQTDVMLKYTRQRNGSGRFRISSRPHHTNTPTIKPLFITMKDYGKYVADIDSRLMDSCLEVEEIGLEQSEKDIEDVVIESPVINRSPKNNVLRKPKIMKQEKQDSEAKLEFNLRIHIPNINGNVDSLMSYYNRKMRYQNPTNVFVFNSKDDYIKRVLLHWGWVENKILDSPFYHLKWAYTDSSNDHKSIPGQILNHFKNNQEMTSKGGLMKNMRSYGGFELKLEEFVPRSYDLTVPADADCFYFEYERATMMAILKKHYKMFVEKIDSGVLEGLRKKVFEKRDENRKRWRNQKYECKPNARKSVQQFSKYEDKNKPREDFLVNIDILIKCIRYCRNQMKLEEDEDWSNPSGFLSYNKEEFIRAFPSILKYSRLSPPYINQESDDPAALKQYSTPSHKLIEKLLKYYYYFESKNKHTWASDGCQNIWVIKPANNARGNGIYLLNDCYQIINSSEGHNRIVQKYIENPLICTNPEYPLIWSKKFDIRQWVLVTSYNPLNAWVFSSNYLRICSENYDISDIKSLQKHLTNYSFNKNNFAKKNESIESLENFKRYLSREHMVSWDQIIKPKIETIIFNTLITCSDNIVDSCNRFELYGFDILIDQQFNPWLLEVNLSPACQQRTEFLKEYCECMGEQLLRIVLPSSYCRQSSLNENQKLYRWQKLPEYYEERRKQELEVPTIKMSLKLDKKIERAYYENDAAIKIQSVMRMIKPKKELRELKKVLLSKKLDKYFRFVLGKKLHTDKITELVFRDVEKIVQTKLIMKAYHKKLTVYNIQTIEKYVNTINPLITFRAKRLSQAIQTIQCIYQHYQCINIIVNHKYTNSLAKKIQRWYKAHYKSKVNAANTIKKHLKNHIYEKKRKQFIHDVQAYTNKITLERYLLSFRSSLQLVHLTQKRAVDMIELGIKQFFDIQKLMKKKLLVFDREVGRVVRVNIRRTRVYYFPIIKDYVHEKLSQCLKLEKYFGVLFEVGKLKVKMRRSKLKVITRYLKGLLAQRSFSKKLLQITEHQNSSSRQQQSTTNIRNYKCPPIYQDRERDSKHKSVTNRNEVKTRERMPMIHRHEEEEKLAKYISRMKETRTGNSRNMNKKH